MFRLFKRKKPKTETAEKIDQQNIIENKGSVPTNAEIKRSAPPSETQTERQIPQEKPSKKGLFNRLKKGLSRTGESLGEGVGFLILGKKQIDEEVLEELETRLLIADVGFDATMKIIDQLAEQVKRKQLKNVDALSEAMYKVMVDILEPVAKPLEIKTEHKPTVVLMVGINGAGKTTTIGKLAKKFQQEGKSVMLAAGDTFRAAAVEQLQIWGERNGIPVIAQGTGADSASVIYDAMESAKARGVDVLLADTAGRLHTQDNLMEELKKVKRVMQKIDPEAPHEVMLIIDASIGQNALAQAKEFNKSIGLTGITVTKLDGTAKGGILFAIAEQASIPVRYVGVGEGIDDLQVFNSDEFVRALLAGESA
jgi:fused signal recognition particle receptor